MRSIAVWILMLLLVPGKDAFGSQPPEECIIECSSKARVASVPGATLGDQSIEFFSTIFDTSKWPPRWQCGEWTPFHGWIYIFSDGLIWLAYFLIPLTLGFFVYGKRKEIIPFRSIIVLFIVFILGCGLTHLLDAAMFWWPAYKLSALVRLITAFVSISTVFALVRIAPDVSELKSPHVLEKMVEARTSELQIVNERLQDEIKQREIAEQKLIQLYAELERKSHGLEETNRELFRRERELIESDEHIKFMNQDLEKKIAERTAALRTSNEELESFTYSVSHDLRAPLRAIDGYARILEEDYNPRLDANGRHLIGVITKNAKYMGQLIDDLLEFSRTSRTEITRNNFQTEEEVRRIISEQMIHEKSRDIEIVMKPLENCHADVRMLRQVWINLVSNALKYTRKTLHAKIEIGSTVKGAAVEYYIKDNGVGFEMQYIDKLFGVFQRLHKKDEFEGTGVGLALVKRVIDRHKGSVWAVSQLHHGATFYFTLPQRSE